MDGALALGGCCLKIWYINQPRASGHRRRYVRAEVWPGWILYGDDVPLFGAAN
jgi:hypothetical protein